MSLSTGKIASSICTSCLSRLSIHSSSRQAQVFVGGAQRSSFTTSASQQNVLAKKKVSQPGAKPTKLRESRSAKIKKKSKDRPRPPAVGERRMQKERIVLSNTNALEVRGLELLTTANSTDTTKLGHVLALNGPLLDQLREAKVFKTTQNWNMFRTPSTLCRGATIELGRDMESVNTEKKTVCAIVDGERGSGKSVHLLQAMSMAYMNEWIVINIPEAQDYVTNTSAYRPASKNDEAAEQMYAQPQLTADLLQRLTRSNEKILKDLKLLRTHNKIVGDRQMNSVSDLANVGVQDARLAPQVWEAVWQELTSRSETQEDDKSVQAPPQKKGSKASPMPTRTTRPPVMIAIDGVNHWMTRSAYRNADYKYIHAQNLSIVKQLTDLLFSKNEVALPNGGMVLGSTTKSNNPEVRTFDILLEQIAARRAGISIDDKAFPMPNPYAKTDKKVFDLLQRTDHVKVTRLNGLSKPESRGLLEYFARSGVFREPISDNVVNEKWSLSGGGVIGEMCKLGKRLRTDLLLDTKPNEGIRIKA